MNIVCGDALGISCGTWIAFWNGAIGAFVGAVLAAGVALLVVWLSNKHQSKLSSAALELQKILARDSLEEQRRQAAAALDQQRKEASKERELSAIAAAVAAADDMMTEYVRGLEAIDRVLQRMRDAIFRWSFEHTVEAESRELSLWPHHLATLAINAFEELRRKDESESAFEPLSEAATLFIMCFSAFPKVDPDLRAVFVDKLRQARVDPDASKEEIARLTAS